MYQEDHIELQEISNTNTGNEVEENSLTEIKVYKKRWYVLGIFCLTCIASVMQLAMHSIFEDDVIEQFGLSSSRTVLELTYNAWFLALIIPGGYILHTFNLRSCLKICITFTCLGAWLQVLAIHPLGHWMFMVTYGLLLSLQVLLIPLALKVSAVWFPSYQRSTALAIGAASAQLGTVAPNLLVRQLRPINTKYFISDIAYLTATVSTILFILVILYFPAVPSTPSSYSQWKITKMERQAGYLKSLKTIFCDSSYVFMLLTTSVIIGVMFPVVYNFDQFLILQFSNHGSVSYVKYVLTADVISAFVGILVAGIILDKFTLSKYTFTVLCILSSLSVILLMELIPFSLYCSYAVSVWLGLSVGALYLTTIYFGAELTYPQSATTSAVILNGACLICGVIIVYLYVYIYNNWNSPFYANLILYALVFVANLLLFRVKFNLRRLKSERDFKTHPVIY